MFIALIGLDVEGIRQIEKYLIVIKNFTRLSLVNHISNDNVNNVNNDSNDNSVNDENNVDFDNYSDMINYVTNNWLNNYVVSFFDNADDTDWDLFLRRPFTLLVGVEGSLVRIQKQFEVSNGIPIQQFPVAFDKANQKIRNRFNQSHLIISSNYNKEIELYKILDDINLLDNERIRPCWDTYFMELADLASRRSNCMKRRVGAVLTQDKRIVATGYNGTPKGLTNCSEGGCKRCNSNNELQGFSECLCLHAEENALLEAGRNRINSNSVLYCNTCPCLGCAIKIIQTGIGEVVYNQAYRVDESTLNLFNNANVILRRFNHVKQIMH